MRIQKHDGINFRNHHLTGVVWPIRSSRSGEIYDVTMTSNGFTCNCIAGQMRGKCKHARYVGDLLVGGEDVKFAIY